MIDGFDPENDFQDRRILYEVTGLRLKRDEFVDEDSSDSDQGLEDEDASVTLLENAFRYDTVTRGRDMTSLNYT